MGSAGYPRSNYLKEQMLLTAGEGCVIKLVKQNIWTADNRQ